MRKKTISSVIQRWMLLIVAVASALSILFTWIAQTRAYRGKIRDLLSLNIRDVRQDVIDASDRNLLKLTEKIALQLDDQEGEITSGELEALKTQFDVSEINVIDSNGIIIATTHPPFLDYDMRSNEQSADFMWLLDPYTNSYVQQYRPTASDPTLSRKYAGVVLKRGGFVQVGYDAERFQQDIDQQIAGVTHNRHVGETGFIIVAGEDWRIVSDCFNDDGLNLDVTGLWIDTSTMPADKVFYANVYGQPSYCMYVFTEGYYIISVLPQDEMDSSRNTMILLDASSDVLVILVMLIAINILIQRLVVKDIHSVNGSLAKIADGDLDEVVDVRDNEEFSSLSDDINSTVDTLKRFIAEAAARIDQELEIARTIQLSVLPRNFPDRDDFCICASMDPAKEVGGDFYDFFRIGDHCLGLVMADVSDKGIPAAMFMMSAKTLIKNRALIGGSPAEILANVNDELCKGNEAGLFVTVWLAILDLTTGKGMAANAGHEHPVLRRAGGSYELVEYRHSPVVAFMKGIPFDEHPFQLFPGDRLLVYTDGVAEATNAEVELFGTRRMLDTLNAAGELSPRDTLLALKRSIDDFVGDAPQFDDITMLCLDYYGTDPE